MNAIPVYDTDVLIVGSGGAGLRAAIEARRAGVDVIVMSKGALGRSGATITASADVSVDSASARRIFGFPGELKDSPEVFLEDVLRGGKYLNNRRLAQVMCEEAPARVEEMAQWGAHFEHLYITPGHTYPRGLWIKGKNFVNTLVRQVRRAGVKAMDHTMAVDLIKVSGRIAGVLAMDLASGQLVAVRAKSVVLATGGGMAAYPITTAPNDLVGDGIAMAYRAGAEIVDAEFPMFLLGMLAPPALVGMNYPFALLMRLSAHLYNREGERFMERWDPVKREKATRDVLTVACMNEILEGRGGPGGGVFLSVRHLPEDLIEHFGHWYSTEWQGKPPWHYEGFDMKPFLPDLSRHSIETAPSCHFWNGGIRIDERTWTGLEGLYACGEAAGGIHGVNRLSGNALTDVLVFGYRAGTAAAEDARQVAHGPWDEQLVAERAQELLALRRRDAGPVVGDFSEPMKWVAERSIGPVRDGETLREVLEHIAALREDVANVRVTTPNDAYNREWVQAIQLGYKLDVMEMVARAALAREESRGSHYRRDFPEMSDQWLCNGYIHRAADGSMALTHKPVSA